MNVDQLSKCLSVKLTAKLLGINHQKFYRILKKSTESKYDLDLKMRMDLLLEIAHTCGEKQEILAEGIRSRLSKFDIEFETGQCLHDSIIKNFNKLLVVKKLADYIIVHDLFEIYAANTLKDYLITNNITPEVITVKSFHDKYYSENIIPRNIFLIGGPSCNLITRKYLNYTAINHSKDRNHVIKEISIEDKVKLWIIYNDSLFIWNKNNSAIYSFLDLLQEEVIKL